MESRGHLCDLIWRLICRFCASLESLLLHKKLGLKPFYWLKKWRSFWRYVSRVFSRTVLSAETCVDRVGPPAGGQYAASFDGRQNRARLAERGEVFGDGWIGDGLVETGEYSYRRIRGIRGRGKETSSGLNRALISAGAKCGRMKNLCLLLAPVALLVVVLILAVAVRTREGVNVVQVTGDESWPVGGFSAEEVRELLE